MRHELYADSRDVAKWSVARRLAKEDSLQIILQIAMLTSDKGRGEGRHHADAPGADPVVHSFFESERAFLAKSPVQNRLARIKSLAPASSESTMCARGGSGEKSTFA